MSTFCGLWVGISSHEKCPVFCDTIYETLPIFCEDNQSEILEGYLILMYRPVLELMKQTIKAISFFNDKPYLSPFLTYKFENQKHAL